MEIEEIHDENGIKFWYKTEGSEWNEFDGKEIREWNDDILVVVEVNSGYLDWKVIKL